MPRLLVDRLGRKGQVIDGFVEHRAVLRENFRSTRGLVFTLHGDLFADGLHRRHPSRYFCLPWRRSGCLFDEDVDHVGANEGEAPRHLVVVKPASMPTNGGSLPPEMCQPGASSGHEVSAATVSSIVRCGSLDTIGTPLAVFAAHDPVVAAVHVPGSSGDSRAWSSASGHGYAGMISGDGSTPGLKDCHCCPAGGREQFVSEPVEIEALRHREVIPRIGGGDGWLPSHRASWRSGPADFRDAVSADTVDAKLRPPQRERLAVHGPALMPVSLNRQVVGVLRNVGIEAVGPRREQAFGILVIAAPLGPRPTVPRNIIRRVRTS